MRTWTLSWVLVTAGAVACANGADDDDSDTDASGADDTDGGSDDTDDTDVAEETDETDVAATACDTYCATIATTCTDLQTQYTDEATCLAVCGQLPVGSPTDTSGNTLACREYHLGMAAGAPATHCGHAGPSGDGMCGTVTENYCFLVEAGCTGENDQYESVGACTTAAADFGTGGNFGESFGDNVVCRLSYAIQAVANPNGTSCDNAGVESAACVDSPSAQ